MNSKTSNTKNRVLAKEGLELGTKRMTNWELYRYVYNVLVSRVSTLLYIPIDQNDVSRNLQLLSSLNVEIFTMWGVPFTGLYRGSFFITAGLIRRLN